MPRLGHLLRKCLVGPQHGMGLQFLIYVLPIGPVVLDLEVERGQVGAVSLWSWEWEQDEVWTDTEREPWRG